MYKRINWLAKWLLSWATCDIYALYSWIKMRNQQNDMARKVGAPCVMHPIFVLLLGAITAGIVPLVWFYRFGRQQSILAQAKGVKLTPVESNFWRWVLLLVPVYRHYFVCANHNALADVYEQE